MRRRAIGIAAMVLAAGSVCLTRADERVGPTTRTAKAANSIGVRVFEWSYRAADGSARPLKTAVWYPAVRSDSRRYAYATGITGQAVLNAPASKKDGPYPLVVYSHGYGGSAIGSTFLTEHLAAHGYVVAAADHNDPVSMVRIDGPTGADMKEFARSIGELLRDGRDHREKYAYRPIEFKAVLDKVLAASRSEKSPLQGMVDPQRIGVGGHSMGGFTSLAVIGCWGKYTDRCIKAAALHSPGVFLCTNEEYARVGVPVMYFYGQYEGRNRAGKLMDTRRAYTHSPAPKWLLAIRHGHHLTFNDRAILRRLGRPSRPRMLQAQHRTICRYTRAMFDRYLKSDRSADEILGYDDPWTSLFERQVRRAADDPAISETP